MSSNHEAPRYVNVSTPPLPLRAKYRPRGKQELRPAVKKLYQLRPKLSVSRASVAFRDVNSKHEELRPAISKELCLCVPMLCFTRISCVPSRQPHAYVLHRKICVYKSP
jgi:hypothetical protein